MVLQKKLAFNSYDFSLQFEESMVRNDRQSIFQLVQDLASAQFELDDKQLTDRLWQEVADRGIDLNRVINLMYGCLFHDDYFEMTTMDERYLMRTTIRN